MLRFGSGLVFFVSGFALGSGDCDSNKCKSESENGGGHCNLLGNCSSGNYSCYMKGKGWKQTCYAGVDVCKMDLECGDKDCEQICNADKCNLACSRGKCKIQKCEGDVKECQMALECNNQDCDQTCDAKNCNLNCCGKKCKTQKCEGKGKECQLDLECNGPYCEQSCDAEKCKLKCSGENCKIQKCNGNECEMDLECNNQDCEQICDANECNLTCSGSKCKKQECKGKAKVCNMHCNAIGCKQTCEGTCNIISSTPTSSRDKLICRGNGECCGRLMPSSIAWSLTTRIFNTDCGAGKSCDYTKCSDSHCITSDSYTSSIVTSIGASTIQVFATKIPTGHGTDAYSEYHNKLNT